MLQHGKSTKTWTKTRSYRAEPWVFKRTGIAVEIVTQRFLSTFLLTRPLADNPSPQLQASSSTSINPILQITMHSFNLLTSFLLTTCVSLTSASIQKTFSPPEGYSKGYATVSSLLVPPQHIAITPLPYANTPSSQTARPRTLRPKKHLPHQLRPSGRQRRCPRHERGCLRRGRRPSAGRGVGQLRALWRMLQHHQLGESLL